jgi:Flp pilus assembly CpaE family ATPase
MSTLNVAQLLQFNSFVKEQSLGPLGKAAAQLRVLLGAQKDLVIAARAEAVILLYQRLPDDVRACVTWQDVDAAMQTCIARDCAYVDLCFRRFHTDKLVCRRCQ